MPLDELLIHPKTSQNIDLFIKRPSHALMLVGAAGSGKTELAKAISALLLGVADLGKYPYFKLLAVAEGKKDIAIEDVREVIKMLRLRVPGTKAIKRVVLIKNAERLSHPAQNAVLKVLEEPASDTVFILTAPAIQSVLPTIASRAQKITVQPIALAHAQKALAKEYNQKNIESAWQISQGRAALMMALLSSEQQHPLKSAISDAKDFLTAKPYERFLKLDSLAKDSGEFKLFLEALERTISALHRASISRGGQAQATRLLTARKVIKKAQKAMDENSNGRLISLELALNLNL